MSYATLKLEIKDIVSKLYFADDEIVVKNKFVLSKKMLCHVIEKAYRAGVEDERNNDVEI